MGGTPYDAIIDLALVSIEDYRLNNIATTDPEAFKEILTGFMIRGLANFTWCKQDLDNRDDELKQFNVTLTTLEKSILADYTVIAWLDKEINDTRQITAMMQNKNEAHRYSEANNLKAKEEWRVKLYEDVGVKKTDYSLINTPWKDWANGIYEL